MSIDFRFCNWDINAAWADAERTGGFTSAGRELPVMFVTASVLRTELEELVLPFYLTSETALVCLGTSGIPAVPTICYFKGLAGFGTCGAGRIKIDPLVKVGLGATRVNGC